MNLVLGADWRFRETRAPSAPARSNAKEPTQRESATMAVERSNRKRELMQDVSNRSWANFQNAWRDQVSISMKTGRYPITSFVDASHMQIARCTCYIPSPCFCRWCLMLDFDKRPVGAPKTKFLSKCPTILISVGNCILSVLCGEFGSGSGLGASSRRSS